ncbi:MAG TPA: hypothetical protein VKP13_05265 [Nitrospira sp.]|nr:hypothetical protein [Nitrospira sp.]
MQMVMMVFRTSLEHEVLPLIEQEQLPFTRLDSVLGKGATGNVPGSTTFGGSNTILLLAVPDERLPSFRDRAHRYHDELAAHHKGTGTPFHTFILPCIQWF